MQTKFDGLHLFAGRLSLFASHLVGAGQLRNRKTPTSSVSASPSHLPLIGEGFGLRPVYLMGYVTPSTVMEARAARSMSWENSQVSFTSPLSKLPA